MRFPNRGGYNSNRNQNFDQRGRGRGFDRPEMHDATCANCGAECQVPFRPNGRREVFCSKCFETMGGGDSRGPRDGRGPRGFGNRESRDSVRTFFSQRERSADNNTNTGPQRPSNSVALAEINAKLDKLISLLSPTISSDKLEEVTEKKKTKTKRKTKTTKKAD